VGATRIGVIAEGAVDHALLPALLERIARGRAAFQWPVLPDDATSRFAIRKRGHGGVLDAVKRIVAVLDRSPEFEGYSFFTIILDRRTAHVQAKVRKLVKERGRFIMGVAIEEIEAWWLGDRKSTLGWSGFRGKLPRSTRYAEKGYKAEKDAAPKKTLDELTDISPALDRRYGDGNTGLALDFANVWKDTARLGDIEGQCPKGFRPFCKAATNAFRRAKARSKP
jgi:hypothetical protein